ncbi:hypothetical protein KIPB_005445 [Kipferlia bialata]|uniref:Rab-GAP TBC domain-containing protein n=1 Tax=Kipferlia bialata TaxID=797122 RepID=A0A9K3CSK4_9EUKA|nr:hypothetical protein KIPB_003714 [Kipferlia bialata]GIQ84024.1 hypothetical protein KIPB_005445 [Kipferlia bialata]|eukprot:g3714.t1
MFRRRNSVSEKEREGSARDRPGRLVHSNGQGDVEAVGTVTPRRRLRFFPSARRKTGGDRAVTPPPQTPRGTGGERERERQADRLRRRLSESPVSLPSLAKLAWKGVPATLRADVWERLILQESYDVDYPSMEREYLRTLQRAAPEGHAYLQRICRLTTPLPGLQTDREREMERERERESNSQLGESVSGAEGEREREKGEGAGAAEDYAASADPGKKRLIRQVIVDVPRTAGRTYLSRPEMQRMLVRIMLVWAARHPAAGYVQGMLDLLMPILIALLSSPSLAEGERVEEFGATESSERVGEREASVIDVHDDNARALSGTTLLRLEARACSMLCPFLSSVQDIYTEGQPMLQHMVVRLESIVVAADPALSRHLQEEGARLSDFAIRWCGCFLTRELPPSTLPRLFDSYFSEYGLSQSQDLSQSGVFQASHDTVTDALIVQSPVAQLHVYVCAALLLRLSPEITPLPYMQFLMLLQNPPLSDYTEDDVAVLIAEAFVLRSRYNDAHLRAVMMDTATPRVAGFSKQSGAE